MAIEVNAWLNRFFMTLVLIGNFAALAIAENKGTPVPSSSPQSKVKRQGIIQRYWPERMEETDNRNRDLFITRDGKYIFCTGALREFKGKKVEDILPKRGKYPPCYSLFDGKKWNVPVYLQLYTYDTAGGASGGWQGSFMDEKDGLYLVTGSHNGYKPTLRPLNFTKCVFDSASGKLRVSHASEVTYDYYKGEMLPQYHHRVARRNYGGCSWEAKVVKDEKGTVWVAYHCLIDHGKREDVIHEVRVRHSMDDGRSWSSPETILKMPHHTEDSEDHRNFYKAINATGLKLVLWKGKPCLFAREGNNFVWRYWDGKQWKVPAHPVVFDGKEDNLFLWTSIRVTSDDHLHAIVMQKRKKSVIRARHHGPQPDSAWSPEEIILEEAHERVNYAPPEETFNYLDYLSSGYPVLATDGKDLWCFYTQRIPGLPDGGTWTGVGFTKVVYKRYDSLAGKWDKNATIISPDSERPFDKILLETNGKTQDMTRVLTDTDMKKGTKIFSSPGEALIFGMSEPFDYACLLLTQGKFMDTKPSWEYWNGERWTLFKPSVSGKQTHRQLNKATNWYTRNKVTSTFNVIRFKPPEDWAPRALKDQTNRYYIRVSNQAPQPVCIWRVTAEQNNFGAHVPGNLSHRKTDKMLILWGRSLTLRREPVEVLYTEIPILPRKEKGQQILDRRRNKR